MEHIAARLAGRAARAAGPGESQPFGEADVAQTLDALDRAGVAAWVDGGWGVDALVGSRTRAHGDLDLVIGADNRARAEEALGALGFRHDRSARPGLPARVVLRDERGRQVDLHPVAFDDAGNGWQSLGGGAWGQYPAEGLTGRGVIGGRGVRCLQAPLQMRHHLGYPPRQTDVHDLRLLAGRFGLALPPGF